jgi:hypothetical protein
VGVGADEGVGVGPSGLLVVEDDPGQILEVDLVNDARVRRHHLEAVEGALPPAKERVALPVALELELGVALEGGVRSEHVDLHGVVDHELRGDQRVDPRGVAAQLGHGVAHGRQVDDGGDAGEVLHQHAGGREADLLGRLGRGVPRGQGLDVRAGHADAVLVAQHVLEEDLQREGKASDVVLRL